jgi:AAA family ATP:ADP antiporter
MPIGIAKALNIEKNEQSVVFILILQSVFIGIYAGSFDVGAQSLFLSVYPASLIPKAFVISGIVGIFITSIYTFLQTRMKFSNFVLINFIFVALATALLRIGFMITEDKRLIFAVFVMMGPLTIISFLGFWGTVGRLFTLRQGKRLFGLIDTGQIIGIIIVSFTIPLLISLNFQVLNTLLLCMVSIMLALALQIIITRRFSFQVIERKAEKEGNFFDLFKSKYTLLMALFIVFSVVAAFFVHFSFLTVLEENYPDPNALASFLGAFMGTLTIFTILIKTFVYGKLMKTYGLKLALILSPLLLGLFTAIAAIIGSIYGFTAASASFAFFFLLIVLSKLFAKSLKDSIEVPASKILYQSLDVNIRYNVQARIDGTVNELAAFSSGLLLAGLGMISFVKIIHFSWVLLFVLFIWVIIGYRLYNAYKQSLESSLQKFQQLSIAENTEIPLLQKIVPGQSESSKVEAVLEFAPQSWNGFISKNIPGIVEGSDKVRSLSLRVIEDMDLNEVLESLDDFMPKANPTQQSNIKNLKDRFALDGQKFGEDDIRKLLKSENPIDRKKALIVILKKNDPKYFPRIVPMFRDPAMSVRISAIHAAGVLNRKDFVTYLIDMLEDNSHYSYAFNALCMMNEHILENLEHGFHKTGITDKGMVRITRVMSSIGTPKAALYLIGKLDHYNKNVFHQAVKGLQKINFVRVESYKIKIFEALNRVAGITAWNLSAKYSFKEFPDGKEISTALDDEISENYDLIYDLLSIAYDRATVYHIRKNLESGTSEGIGFAIELLDMFIDETVKPYLFPLLDDSPVTEKVRLLQSEFPVELMQPEDLLLAIVNRDYNQINPYTRVCAIHALKKIEGFHPGKDMVAQMFNPDPLLREESSLLVSKLDNNLFKDVLKRVPAAYNDKIIEFLTAFDTNTDCGVFRKFSYLRENKSFDSFKSYQLLSVARSTELINQNVLQTIEKSLNPEKIIIIVEGELTFGKGESLMRYEKGGLIDIDHVYSIIENHNKPEGSKNLQLMLINKSSIQELIFDDENTYFPFAELIYSSNLV